MNREKQGQQDHEASVYRKGRTNACHLPGTSDVLLGDCLIADNSLYLPRRTFYDARNTECCMPDCFSTNPPLSPRQTVVIEAVRKE